MLKHVRDIETSWSKNNCLYKSSCPKSMGDIMIWSTNSQCLLYNLIMTFLYHKLLSVPILDVIVGISQFSGVYQRSSPRLPHAEQGMLTLPEHLISPNLRVLLPSLVLFVHGLCEISLVLCLSHRLTLVIL